MKTQIPIYRAKKIDSDKYVEISLEKLFSGDTFCVCEIDQSTLKISFDGGKSWLKLSDLEIHTCADFDLTYNDMKMRTKKINQPPNGSIFILITDKGR